VPEFKETEDVTLVVNSPRADAWARYFNNTSRETEGTVTLDRENDTVVYEFETGELNVPQVTIRVRTIN
jgi:hypothetical protein